MFAVPALVSRERSIQCAIPTVKPDNNATFVNGTCALPTTTLPDKDEPIAVPVKAAPFVGAEPVPNLILVSARLLAALTAALPDIKTFKRPVVAGVITQEEPSPIITPVVLVVPVGLEGDVESVALLPLDPLTCRHLCAIES